MPDDLTLRLRTAAAMRWVLDSEKYVNVIPDGRSRVETYRRGDQRAVVCYYPDGEVAVEVTMPPYGVTWASCEELDAECKARGWWYTHDMCGDDDMVSIFENDYCLAHCPAAPTFPAAFALAFCEAVENE